MSAPILSKRLLAAASFVRDGAVVADVGTDHAYLPIYLVLCGRVSRAVASDINEGPYLRALQNIKSYALENKIDAVCTSGLCGIEKYKPTDILICGMGGELIASIIEDAPFVKDGAVRLILQPMTHPELLRKYLCEHGFAIIGEELAKEEKIYQIICAQYVGEHADKDYTDSQLLLGKINIQKRTEELVDLIDNQLVTLKKIRKAKLSGSADTTLEDKMINCLEELKNDCK